MMVLSPGERNGPEMCEFQIVFLNPNSFPVSLYSQEGEDLRQDKQMLVYGASCALIRTQQEKARKCAFENCLTLTLKICVENTHT